MRWKKGDRCSLRSHVNHSAYYEASSNSPPPFPPLWTTKPYFHHLYFTAVTWFQGSVNSLSSSTYHTMGVKVFPLVLLRITFISHKAKLITAFTCQKTRKHTECEELLKKNRLKYKMSWCCFNTLRPSPSKAGSPFLPVILSTGLLPCLHYGIHHSSSLAHTLLYFSLYEPLLCASYA